MCRYPAGFYSTDQAMIENVSAALDLFLHAENFLVIAIGVLVGLIVGAIPGLTAVMAVALALPFTFHMAPIPAILLLVGIYKGGVLGGSISAILIRAPGTPAAACTTLDGYPMTRKGEGRKALLAALYASCIADFVSNFSLILFAGLLATIALRFGPPEYLWLVAFSLTVVIAISSGSLLNGLIAATTGMIVAMIGLDLVYGTERLTFGSMQLMGGISFVPMLIGLFAIPEVIGYYEGGIRAGAIAGPDSSKMSWRELRRCLPTILRGSGIGVIIGAIPGAGPTAAAFLSYGVSKRISKRGDLFGTGEVEGVCAAEAGNNGVAGATLIPLLALGIPGDVVTAVILGAFMIHDLSPGPLLFRDNLGLIYAIFMGIMLSSIVLFVFGRFVMATFAKVTQIPQRLLMPMLFVCCVYGSFAVNNNMFDVYLMLVFGILGYTMIKIKMPAAPFLLGFILAPKFEDNLRRALLIGDDWTVFFRSATCWIFIALFLFSLCWGLKREWQDFRRARIDRKELQRSGQPS